MDMDFTLKGRCDLCQQDRLITRKGYSARPGYPVTIEICRPCAQALLSRFKHRRRGGKRG